MDFTARVCVTKCPNSTDGFSFRDADNTTAEAVANTAVLDLTSQSG